MRLASYTIDGEVRFGLVAAGRVADVRPQPSHPCDLIVTATRPELGAEHELDEVELLPPVRPSQVISVDDNFTDQARRRAGGLAAAPVPALEPFLTAGPADDAWFLARDPTSLVGASGSIIKPSDCRQLDCGVSLALVIARDALRVGVADAWSFVAGVTVAIDVVRCDLPGGQGSLARSYSTHTPLGPYLVTPDELPSLASAAMSLTVDGVEIQRSSVSAMRAPPAALIAAITRRVPLGKGDVVLTGTPGGTLTERGETSLLPGMELRAAIDGVGALEMRVTAEIG